MENKLLYDRKSNLVKILIWLGVLALYFVSEPLFAHARFLYDYAILNIPYSFLYRVVPYIIIAAFVYELIKKKFRLHYGMLLFVAILFACYLIPTSEYGVWYDTFLRTAAVCILLMPLCSDRETLKTFIKLAAWLYLVIAAIDLAYTIFQNITVENYKYRISIITQIQNQSGFVLMMGLLFALLDSYFNGSRVKTAAYILIFFADTVLAWTAACVVGAIVFAIWLVPPVRKLTDRMNPIVYVIVAFVMFAVLVFFWEKLMSLPIVSFITSDVLHKDVTLTGRVDIWQGITELVRQKPLFGHGLMENPLQTYFDEGYNHGYVHAHSAFLQTLYEGGILTLAAVFALLTAAAAKLRRCSDRKLAGIFGIVIFMMLINLEVDQFFMLPFRSGCWCLICFITQLGALISDRGYEK